MAPIAKDMQPEPKEGTTRIGEEVAISVTLPGRYESNTRAVRWIVYREREKGPCIVRNIKTKGLVYKTVFKFKEEGYHNIYFEVGDTLGTGELSMAAVILVKK